MRFKFLGCLFLATASLSVTRGSSRADDPRAAVAVTIGPRKITVGELEDRMQAVPRFQLDTFGDPKDPKNEDAIRKKFVDEVILPEALLSLGAEARKLDQTLPTSYQMQRARSSATMSAVRAQLGPASAIPLADVQQYYDANRSHYDAPERYAIWRIACKTKEEAETVLAAAKKDPTPKAFEELAREHSLDKGTYLRGGNLGFVAPDGSSNEAGVRVDPAVPAAAATVRDGQLVDAPVVEGDDFAVVWRRGTIGASHRTVAEASGQIRDSLWKQRVEQAQKKLIDDLRARDVKDLHEDLLEGIDVSAKDGNIATRKRPGQVAPLTPGASSK